MIVETTGEDGRVHASHVLVSWLDHRTVVSNLVLAVHQETSDKEAKSSGQIFVDCQSMGTLLLANSPKTMKSDERPIRVVISHFDHLIGEFWAQKDLGPSGVVLIEACFARISRSAESMNQ